MAALFEPRRLQFHFWHGLGLPVLQALGNEKTSAYWVNYRRDGLMAAMMNLSPLPQAMKSKLKFTRVWPG